MAGTETKRIIELTEASTVQSGDYIAVDSNARGTKKVPTDALATSAALTAEQTARQQADTELDGKITAEAQARAGLKSDLGEITVVWTDGKLIQFANGNEGSSTAYSHTDYIACAGIGLKIKTEVYNDISGIAFYDSDRNYLSGYNNSADNYTLANVVIPDNASLVRFTCLTRYKNSFEIVRYNSIDGLSSMLGRTFTRTANQETEISHLNGITETSKNVLPVAGNTVTFANVTMSYNDGEITYSGTANNSGGRTQRIINPITLQAGTYSLWAIDGIAQIFLENAADNSIITSIAGGNSWFSTFTLDSETSVYIGSNVTSGETYDHVCKLMLESGDAKTEYERPSVINAVDNEARKALVTLDRYWAFAVWKTLCIGDSLTSGACFTGSWNGASIDQNYPRLLGRMLDADVTNGGVSGLTASQWYTNEISKYTLANYDTFIIWLGTNGGLTDTLDTDVDPYSDYNDFANTNTGNYCKIIERIKANNPDCLIILTKVFATSGSMGVATTNTVIDKIAERYNLEVVDNSDLTISAYPALHGNINNVHFSKTGNLYIANRYVEELTELFADDPAITNYGLTARTN